MDLSPDFFKKGVALRKACYMAILFDISPGILEHFVIDKYRPSGKYVGTTALEKLFLNLAPSCWDHSATCEQDPGSGRAGRCSPRDFTFVQFPL